MSSSEAQKSPIHHATEDSTAEPTNDTARPVATPEGRSPGGGGAAGGGDDAVRGAADLKSRPDTAMGVPGNFERGAAMAGRHPDTAQDANAGIAPGEPVIGGGPGAGDASSGGGAGAGVPGGGTDMRTGGAFSGGDVEEDRKKLFPDHGTRADTPGGTASGPNDTKIPNDPDESSYGGPLNLDDPEAV